MRLFASSILLVSALGIAAAACSDKPDAQYPNPVYTTTAPTPTYPPPPPPTATATATQPSIFGIPMPSGLPIPSGLAIPSGLPGFPTSQPPQ